MGEEEATFDWLGVNDIWHKLNNAQQHTLGALDLGGQSPQIAFAPDPQSNILAAFTAVRLYEITHRLYTHSFLQYGTNAIEQRIAQLSYELFNSVNPCLNTGVSVNYTIQTVDGQSMDVTQVGNSNVDPFACRTLMRKLLSKNETTCYVQDCSFNGVYLAQIPDNMTFVAFSAFGYAISGLNLSSHIDLGELYNDVTVNICNMTWDELQGSKWNMA